MAQYGYAKPPVFYYQTIDRHSLQFTNYPVFSVHQPQPPPPTPAVENEGSGEDGQKDGGPDEDAAADDVGEIEEGECAMNEREC